MIPFNKPYASGLEQGFIEDAISSAHLSGDGKYSKLCSQWLQINLVTPKALLTHSCTAALEMAAILADIQPGDEVIMPSYTFVSTANAFVLRGGVPVFVDIRLDTLNIDEAKIEQAITPRTKAIVPVHYAGVPCDMDAIMDIANRHNLLVIEDAAQGITSKYKGRNLGTIGHFGCLSFHETKNVICGEGGALLINDPGMIERAEIIREKGTNRSQFHRGVVDKYTWWDIGSSYLPSELNAAYLWGQLNSIDFIQSQRIALWNSYYSGVSSLEIESLKVREPMLEGLEGNAHMFYLLARDTSERNELLDHFKSAEIGAVFHYIPLHTSPAGLRFGKSVGSMANTEAVSQRILRLPLYPELGSGLERVIDCIRGFYRG